MKLVTSLAEYGHDVTLVTGDREASFVDHIPPKSVSIPEARNLVARKIFLDYFNPYAVRAFRTLVNDIKPDLIHFHSFYGLSSSLAWVAKTYCPVIVTLHDSWCAFYDSSIMPPERNFANKAWKAPLGYLHRKANQFFLRDTLLISPSIWLRMYFEKTGFLSPTHIPNGIADSHSTTSYSNILLWVGDLNKFKGLPSIIDTLVSRTAQMHWRLVVVGDGPYRKTMRSKYPTVEFVGYCDPEPYYRQASILIFSSIGYENFPTVILEAMQHGICVVGYNVGGGGVTELVQDKKTGILYNSLDSLSESLLRLMADRKEIRRLGTAAKKITLFNYCWDKCYSRYLSLYRSLN